MKHIQTADRASEELKKHGYIKIFIYINQIQNMPFNKLESASTVHRKRRRKTTDVICPTYTFTNVLTLNIIVFDEYFTKHIFLLRIT